MTTEENGESPLQGSAILDAMQRAGLTKESAAPTGDPPPPPPEVPEAAPEAAKTDADDSVADPPAEKPQLQAKIDPSDLEDATDDKPPEVVTKPETDREKRRNARILEVSRRKAEQRETSRTQDKRTADLDAREKAMERREAYALRNPLEYLEGIAEARGEKLDRSKIAEEFYYSDLPPDKRPATYSTDRRVAKLEAEIAQRNADDAARAKTDEDAAVALQNDERVADFQREYLAQVDELIKSKPDILRVYGKDGANAAEGVLAEARYIYSQTKKILEADQIVGIIQEHIDDVRGGQAPPEPTEDDERKTRQETKRTTATTLTDSDGAQAQTRAGGHGEWNEDRDREGLLQNNLHLLRKKS